MKNYEGKKKIAPLHPASAALLLAGLLGFTIHILSIFYTDFANLINSTLGAYLRFILAKIFDILPFSFAEFLLFLSPVIIIVTVYLTVKCAKLKGIYVIRALSAVLSMAAGVYFCFSVAFAPAYRTTPLGKNLGITQRNVSAEELYEVTLTVIEELRPLCDKVDFIDDGASLMPYDIYELSEHLSSSYKDLSKEYSCFQGFSSKVKPLIISPIMTYTHISGIYSFFTGEANLNTNYPDFINTYTAAHEMAHQRGIAREDEANFLAFLVCRNSDSDYIRYCAYMNMYDYLSSALYSADKELYKNAWEALPPKAKGEFFAYSNFFDKYRNSKASEVSDSLNNAYLESQGAEGTKSYGMVVDLAVSFYLDGHN